MILHSLKHCGTYAFPDHEIAIDFERLPAVLGVSGKNGAGKTTLQDLVPGALFLEFPYRPTALWRQFLRPGYIDMVWEPEDGAIYRSLIRVSPDVERTEASLFLIGPEGDETLIAGPLSKQYRQAVEAIVGPLDIFLAAAYATQSGVGAFLKASRADRKGVLATMLALQRYPRLLEATKTRAGQVDVRLASLRTQLATHEATAAQRPALEAKRTALLERKAAAETQGEQIQAALAQTLEQVTLAREAKAKLEPLKAELPRLEKEIADLTTRITGHETRLANNRALLARADEIARAVARDAEIRTAKTRLEALRPERDQLVTQLAELDTRIARIQGEIDANRSLLTRAEEIRTACKRDGELAGQVETLDAEIEEARAAYHETTTERNRLALDRRKAEENVRTFMADVDRYQRQAALRGTVPCEGADIYAACQFLADATQAARDLPLVTEALQIAQADLGRLIVPAEPTDGSVALQGRKAALQGERRALADVVVLAAGLDASEARLEGYAGQLADAERDRTAKAVRRDALDAELAQLPELEAELLALTAAVAEKTPLDAATSRIEELTAALTTMEGDLGTRILRRTEVSDLLASLPTLEEQVMATQRVANEAEDRRRQAQQDVTVVERDLGVVESQVTGALEAETAAAALRGEVAPLAEDLADWTLLSRGFGPSGIPALKIDQALPEIGSLATDLLRDCFGESVFTIELRTQRDSADGERKLETLDVIVSRGGEPLEAALLSGGESVLVSESLSLALALYNATRSGRAIRTLLRDEVSAPLDVERAPAYARMLRRAAQLGGFRHVLFVSHQPACLELADAQLEVGGGAVKVA